MHTQDLEHNPRTLTVSVKYAASLIGEAIQMARAERAYMLLNDFY